MIVNELAKRAGIKPHVVRYYTRIGLLKPWRDRNNGYKLFSTEDINRLEFIRRVQHIGFTLSDIAAVFDQYEIEGCDESCQTMHAILCRRIEEHRRKCDEMIMQQQRMDAALAHWDEAGGAGYSCSPVCPSTKPGDCSCGY